MADSLAKCKTGNDNQCFGSNYQQRFVKFRNNSRNLGRSNEFGPRSVTTRVTYDKAFFVSGAVKTQFIDIYV